MAMESTGVYWIPLYEILEKRSFEVLLVNARMLSSVPGRKTDMLDCQWIQRLHSCGLLRGSFRPKETVCRWRALVREKNMMEDKRADWLRRIQKSLNQMNVQVHHAVSDISGHTGMSIIRAIVSGERDVRKLAELRDPRCRKSVDQIAEHLTGNWRDEHLTVWHCQLHLLVMAPPKVSISNLVGTVKGRTAIRALNKYKQLKKKPSSG